MADVRRVKLPGVGVLHTFVTDDGGKCGVITHRSGHSDLITFSDDADGADVKKVSLRLSEDEARLNRVGLGHAEGFLEAFANYYSDIAEELFARRDGKPLPQRELGYPTGADGLVGLQFVEAVTASSNANSAWVRPATRKAGQ